MICMLSLHSSALDVDGCLLPNNVVYRSTGIFIYPPLERFQEVVRKLQFLPIIAIGHLNGTRKLCLRNSYGESACFNTPTLGIGSTNCQMAQHNLDNYTFALSAAAGLCGVSIIRSRRQKK